MWEIPHNLVIYSFNDQANIVTYVVKLLMLNWVLSLFNLSFKIAAKKLSPLLHLIPPLSKISQHKYTTYFCILSLSCLTYSHHTTLCQRRGLEAYTYLNAIGSCFQQGLSSIPKSKVHVNIGTVIQNLEMGVTKIWIHLFHMA